MFNQLNWRYLLYNRNIDHNTNMNWPLKTTTEKYSKISKFLNGDKNELSQLKETSAPAKHRL